MPRFFFNTVDQGSVRDVDGIELADLAAAHKHGIVVAGQVMHREPDVLWDDRDFIVEVSDKRGLLLFTITAFATNAAAGGDTKWLRVCCGQPHERVLLNSKQYQSLIHVYAGSTVRLENS